MSLIQDVDYIVAKALRDSSPKEAVQKALSSFVPPRGKLVLVAIGKAAWTMAAAAYETLGDAIDSGVVITKHGHSQGAIGALLIREGGHPVPDNAGYAATEEVVRLVEPLTADDAVVFLVSGGGSALFEKPTIPEAELQDVTKQLLACGADIVEINTIRKRLSAVKGGRFAQICAPAKIFAVVLSDILGDPLDMIASGPAYPDASTSRQAIEIVKKYELTLSAEALAQLHIETPKTLDNVETHITGSVRELCASAAAACRERGYQPLILTDRLCCEAREAGSFLASIARSHENATNSLAFIAGGETVVHLTGDGLGGRNQELALGAAQGIAGIRNCAIFSLGSDGTDGPTDAAGAICTGESLAQLTAKGVDVHNVLKNNDSYHALKQIGALIVTGPTGVNVNDVVCVLIKR